MAHEQLTPAAKNALESYRNAIRESPSLDGKKDKEIYDYIESEVSEIYGKELPSFETWSRNLRLARNKLGWQKNKPRAGRPHGKSIVDADELDRPERNSPREKP
jgi:hypothetical protein